MAMNKVLMVGRLTADPELRQTTSGIEVTRFSIAINMATNKTDYFAVVAWKQTATFICRHFSKGDGICIDGHLSSRSYEKDGVKHTIYEVICETAGFSEGRGGAEAVQEAVKDNNARQGAFSQAQDRFAEHPSEDGLPF